MNREVSLKDKVRRELSRADFDPRSGNDDVRPLSDAELRAKLAPVVNFTNPLPEGLITRRAIEVSAALGTTPEALTAPNEILEQLPFIKSGDLIAAEIESRRPNLGAPGDEGAGTWSPEISHGMLLSADPAQRKAMPITTGVLDYFPLAMAEVSKVSKAGNDQHNPGQPLHWDKTKSLDHADCIARHLIDRGSRDTDGMRHSAKLVWRALALLETELGGA